MESESKNNNSLFDVNSKFMKIFLVLVAALLVFAGPTYIPYLLAEGLSINYVAAMVFGFGLLIAGLVLIFYLIRKKIIE